jgi:alkylhydroperoxidase family enzyme
MPHIDLVLPDDAEGTLAGEYDAALRRAGRIWNIVAIQSRTPEALRASMQMYVTLMYGPGPLDRSVREMLAVVTSQTNDCHY